MAKRFWTAAELSAEFGVPLKTLYRWREDGRGPRAIRVGRWLKYPAAEVDRWLAARAETERPRYERAPR